ncbi:MAG: PsaF/MyfF family fimbrial adhesin regulatory protein [Acinetobacter sp.]
MKKNIAIALLSVLVFIIYTSITWRYSFHTDKKYLTGSEHMDIKIKGVTFSIDHFVLGKSGEVLLSEHLSGFHIKSYNEEHYLFPIKRVNTFSNERLSGALAPLGMLSVCIYPLRDNIIAFFDIDRGMTMLDGNAVHLSSLFLGKYGRHACPLNE